MALSGSRYANITATLALVISLGGVGYAATQLPKNSVGSKQVKNGSLKAKDLKKGVIPKPNEAYALLGVDGSVTHNKGITAANVTREGLSLYCIEGLGFSPTSLTATPALVGGDDSSQQVAIGFGPNGNLGCSSDTNQVIISTHTDAGGPVRFPVMVRIS